MSKTRITAVDDRLAFSVEDTVRVSGLSRSLLYTEIKAGRLPIVKVGTRTLIRRAALASFLESLEKKSPTEAA